MPILPWLHGRRPVVRVASLDEHPNRGEILAIRRRATMLREREITGLARLWRNTPYLAAIRARALSVDAPLVVDVLHDFATIEQAFDEVLTQPQAIARVSSATLHPTIVETALKAVRDALAAAYAQPVLRPREYLALGAPWRRVIHQLP
ncbi:MAG: hypothetical protein IRZ27_00455 [Acidothermus cellulolyticus]|nr:hypothetical protein [Acidothermus cellulolyticus]MCL6551289.1 hypothetical protein [Acidothermus cellulolyticus]